MRWSLLIAVFGLSITDVSSFAQGRPDDQRLSTTRSTPEDAGFFASRGVVRFQLIQGRLSLDAPRHRKGSQNRDEDGVYESITVTAERGIPSMHYVYQTPQHHLTLSVQKADAMRLESWSPETGERSVLEQPALGEITWTHTRGDLKDVHQGATLLHIRCADVENFDRHFGAMFRRMLRGQTIARYCREVRSGLLQQQVSTEAPAVAEVQHAIEQLRSPRRAKRMAAENQLLAWGTPVVPTIQSLSLDTLDNEQRDRLRLVMKRLRPREDDTPASLARLLINDHHYWSLVAGQLNPRQLAVANGHLERVGLDIIEAPAAPSERIASTRE